MTRLFVGRTPGKGDNIGALAVTLGVAAATFYLVRIVLARETVESGAPALPGPSRVLPAADDSVDGPA